MNSFGGHISITQGKHRADQLNEFSGGDYLSTFMRLREVLGVSGDQKVGLTCFSAFIKPVVRFVRRFFNRAFGFNHLAAIADDGQ